MKWSMFIFKVEANGSVLLYNTFNYAVVILEEDIYNKICQMIESQEIEKTDEVEALVE